MAANCNKRENIPKIAQKSAKMAEEITVRVRVYRVDICFKFGDECDVIRQGSSDSLATWNPSIDGKVVYT